jgi:hypothetical protein
MEPMAERLVLEFDTKTGKMSVNGGVLVYFRGFTTEEKYREIEEEQRERDKRQPPPSEPNDRDGVLVCKLAAGATFTTWHVCTTVPPYTCTNSGARCP